MNNDKLSQYNVEVEHDDYMLLFNGLTSKLLPVSYEQYAALETLMEHLPEFQKMYPELYESFKASGFIVDQDFDELAYIKLQNKRKVLINKDYHITINPTLDCNLKCWYCSVSYAGAKHNKERMSDETVDALKKHILHLVKDQGAASILLDWFGGEPTMYYDEVIREVCKFIKEEKLDEFMDQLSKIYDWSRLPSESDVNCNSEIAEFLTQNNDIENFDIALDAIDRSNNPARGKVICIDNDLIWIKGTDTDVPPTFYIVQMNKIPFICKS
mgnify:CR=1 FL=1